MSLSERIQHILDYSGKNISEFSRFVGFKTPQAVRELIKGNTKSLSDAAAMHILNAFPEINETWLRNGDGEMLNANQYDCTSKQDENDSIDEVSKSIRNGSVRMVPLINIDSVGGIHSQNLISPEEQYIIKMMPFTEARYGDVAILQTGSSMYPTIPSGSALLIREVVDWREYFGYGGIYVLWLRDGRRITKEVRRYDADPKNYVWCVSYNPDVADEELPKSMIVGVWKVVKFIADFGW